MKIGFLVVLKVDVKNEIKVFGFWGRFQGKVIAFPFLDIRQGIRQPFYSHILMMIMLAEPPRLETDLES